MSGKPLDVFPDLHHKMSKKIAQLTKVIYHLNTKNEDHQSEIENITANNQQEIQNILRDAALKIGKFKEMIEAKQTSTNAEAQVANLEKKHSAEKQAALREFEAYKIKVKEREQKISSEFQTKFEQVQEKVEAMNSKFRERIEAFDKVSQQYQQDLSSARSSGNQGMEDIRKKHQLEMDEFVRRSNEKYEKMLLDQLQIQDQLKEDFEAKMKALRLELETNGKAALEKQVGTLRAQLNGEKQEALMQVKREYDDKLQKLKEDHMINLQKALDDLKKKSEDIVKMKEERDSIVQSLNDTIKALQTNASSLQGESSQQMAKLSKELSASQSEVSRLKDEINSKSKDNDSLKLSLSALQNQYDDLSGQMSGLEAELLRLNDASKLANLSKEASELEMTKQLKSLSADLSLAKEKVGELTNSLNQVRDELSRERQAAKSAAEKSQNTIENLNGEIKKLQDQIRDINSSSSKAKDKIMDDLSLMRKQMNDKEAEFAKAKQDLDIEHRKLMQAAADRHRTEVLSLESAQQELNALMKAKEVEYNGALDRQKKSFEAEQERFENSSKLAMENLVNEHTEAIGKLKGNVSMLENQIQELLAQADNDKGVLKVEVGKLDAKVKSLQKDLDARKKESERSESVCNGLKNQVENLREELKQAQLAYKQKMEIAKQEQDAEWQKKLDALSDMHSKLLQDGAEESMKSFKLQMETLTKDYENQIAVLKQALQKEASEARENSLLAEQERLKLENSLTAERAAHMLSIETHVTKHNKEVTELKELHKKELDSLQRSNNESSEARWNEMKKLHDCAIEKLTEESIKERENLFNKCQKENAEKISILENSHAKKVEELLVLGANEKSNALNALKSSFQAESDAMKLKYNAEKDGMLASNAELSAKLANAEKRIREVEGFREAEQLDFARREGFLNGEKEQLRKDCDAMIRKERELLEAKLSEATAKMNAEVKTLKSEFQEDCARFEERMQQGRHEYEKLLEKYRNRESRPEDVRRIEDLEAQMIEKDKLVASTREEMNYFKREMLNREEAYNTKFNVKPVVGVLNPLAGKSEKNKSEKRSTSFIASNTGGSGIGSSGSIGGLGIGFNQSR